MPISASCAATPEQRLAAAILTQAYSDMFAKTGDREGYKLRMFRTLDELPGHAAANSR